MKIGVYDSGIGGLSVLQELMLALPGVEFIYYADVDHVPYGEKSREEIICFADLAVRFLLEQQVQAIVVACNTATSAAISTLRARYTLPILGMEPAIKPALQCSNGKRVLLLATPLTLREAKLQHLIAEVDKAHLVDVQAMPCFVRFAEQGQFHTDEVYAYCCRQLEKYQADEYSAVVLGCTHFNYFKDTLRRRFPEPVRFVDGCQGTSRNLVHILQEQRLLEYGEQSVVYYMSGRPADSQQLSFINKCLQHLHNMREI